MTDVADLLWTSVKAIVPVFVVLGSGAWLVRQGVLDERASNTLSWLAKWVYSPALLFVRLGEGVDRALFAEVWVLAVMGIVFLGVNFVLGMLLAPLARPSRKFRKWFVYSMTFPNIMALPLVFISAVCAGGNIRKPPSMAATSEGDFLTVDECTERGQLYLFIYIIVPNTLMFATATILASSERATDEDGSCSTQTCPPTRVMVEMEVHSGRDQDDDAAAAARGEGEELALPAPHPAAPPAAEASIVDGEAESPNPSAPTATSFRAHEPHAPATRGTDGLQVTAADPQATTTTTTTTTTTAASTTVEGGPGAANSTMTSQEVVAERIDWPLVLRRTIAQPAVSSQILAIIVAVVPPLQSFLFSENTVATPFISVLRLFAPGLVSVIMLALSTLIGSKLVKTRYSDLMGGDEEVMGISRRTLLVFVLGRTLIIPGISFVLMYLALDLFPKDQLLLIILFFECFVPTANMCALCAPPAQGQIISLGMVNQYMLGIVTMTGWCFAALSITTAATANV